MNQGSITAGFAALLGPTVENSGSIITYKGLTALGAANAVTLDFDTSGLIALTLEQEAYNAQVSNSGIIEADGGLVLLTAKSADSILKSMVNNSGVIRARSVETSNGQILLLGDMDNGTVKVGGTLDATGGFIETSAHDVSLQSGATVKVKSWLIDPTDITIDAAAASTIVTSLDAGTNITETTSGGGSDAGNITVASAVSWTGTGILTLNADHDININAAITGINGGLTLSAGNYISATAAVNVGTFTLSNGTWSQINSSLPGFSATGFRISGGSFLRALGGDGTSGTPYQLTDIYGLQGIGSSGMLANSYILANDINAFGTVNWNSGAGFNPIGSYYTAFNGSFDGAAHSISNLYINRSSTDYVGLFGSSSGTISNVGLTNGSVTGHNWVGGLVGSNSGTISNSFAGVSVSGGSYVGGLAGSNAGTISDSYATGNVASSSNGYFTGGLTGFNSGTISNVYATGTVSGENDIGGLVGLNNGGASISDSSATGSVTGSGNNVGGLVGHNRSSISNSYASGNVNGIGSVGGLVGYSEYGSISDSYATIGSVTGSGNTIGGLVGRNSSSVSNSYADGNVTGGASSQYVGGLVGYNYDGFTISGSHATGTVAVGSGGYYTGGLVGLNEGSVSSSYATGSASGGSYVGGLAGFNNVGTISSSYASGNVTGTSYVGGLAGAGPEGISNSFYDIDNVSINGSHQVGVNGIYNAQFQNWLGHSKSLNIADYFSQDVDGYYLIGSIQKLKDILGFSADSAAYRFRLTTDLDLSTAVLTATNWYIPILNGSFDGNSHILNNLTVNQANNYSIGLVGSLAAGGIVSNLGLTNVQVTGNTSVGGLVGYNQGTISNSSVTGSVTGTDYAGGLVGYNQGTISDSYATASVSGASYAGGLAGYNQGAISNSFYDIDNASINGFHQVGSYGIYFAQLQDWLAHGKSLNIADYFSQDGDGYYQIGSIQDLKDILGFSANSAAYRFRLTTDLDLSTAALTATNWYIPILSGSFDGNSHILNNLTLNQANNSYIGLVGMLVSGGSISDLGLTNVTISGSRYVGGLAGINGGTISNSYASGAVSGSRYVGGLVGYNVNGGTINNAYAAVSVTSSGYLVGGLVGYNTGSISNVYATGSVSGSGTVGGLVGYNGGTINSSFFDTSTTGKDSTAGCGDSASCSGVTGLTTAAMKSYSSFSSWGSTISTTGGSSAVWRIYDGNTYPLLRSFLTPLTVTANNDSKTYNGTAYTGGNGVTYSVVNPTLSGTLAYGGTSQGAINAGSYAITPSGFYSNQQGYDINYVNGLLTINAAALNAISLNGTRAYDGTTIVNAGIFTLSGLVGGETLTLSGAGQVADKNVGVNKPVSLGTLTLGNGSGLASNYTFSGGTQVATITPAPLAIAANNASKTYDGAAYSGGNGVSYSGFVNGETSTVLGGSLSYGGTSQGAINAGSYGIVPSGLTADNYSVSYHNGQLTITPAPLSVTANSASKVYGQTNNFNGTEFSATGLKNNETIGTVSLSSAGTAATAGVNNGTPYSIIPSNASGGSFNAGNYTITYNNGQLTITPAPLTVTANNASKTYDGNAYSGGNGVSYSGFVNNETATVLGGTVSYGGTSQGAVNTGNYTINPSGLTATNYALSYANGALTVQAAPTPIHTGIINPATGKTTPDMIDARTLLQFLLGQQTPTTAQFIAADVNPLGANNQPQGDGVLDFGDLITLMRRINGAVVW